MHATCLQGGNRAVSIAAGCDLNSSKTGGGGGQQGYKGGL